VLGDGLRLEQVLHNLLSNAVKHSPAGGEVTVALAADAGGVRLAVRDEGIGLPASYLPHVFERFYRAGNVSADTLTVVGIGLFVVQEIVALVSEGAAAAASPSPSRPAPPPTLPAEDVLVQSLCGL
jgi:two-component system heavy metal sensor histidine kinase CusS